MMVFFLEGQDTTTLHRRLPSYTVIPFYTAAFRTRRGSDAHLSFISADVARAPPPDLAPHSSGGTLLLPYILRYRLLEPTSGKLEVYKAVLLIFPNVSLDR